MRKFIITLLVGLCSLYSFGQDINSLLDTLKNRGYIITKEDVKDIMDLKRYLALDIKLKNKQNSVDSIFSSMNDHFRYLEDGNTDVLQSIREYANTRKNIKSRYIKKNGFYLDEVNYLPKLLNDYEKEINRYDDPSFKRYLESAVDGLKRAKDKFVSDSIRVNKEKTELASLPSKATINTKFRKYTHKLGYVFEWFPVGFTPKGGKPVIDRVFGRKARYREVGGNGMNTLMVEYYSSGNIQNVTVYGAKGGGFMYYAEYRDNAKKPYEISTKSADGKFYVVHKRIYDMYDQKTNISTRYQYVPLDYYYE